MQDDTILKWLLKKHDICHVSALMMVFGACNFLKSFSIHGKN